jgi:predicted RNase H-like nuclease (RuvC/YqgF family)
MPPVLELNPTAEHAARLRQLLRRYRNEAVLLEASLQELQAEIEFWQRETVMARQLDADEADRLAERCREMQNECDHLSVELAHVRLAQAGAAAELSLLRRDPTSFGSVA